jgi:hypothetical protein
MFALLRLLPMSSRDKDAEILALRHQLLVLQRQLGPDRVRFAAGDRALLAALLHPLPSGVLKGLHLVVRPDTVLRWHRDMLARRHARRSGPMPGPAAVRQPGVFQMGGRQLELCVVEGVCRGRQAKAEVGRVMPQEDTEQCVRLAY